MYNTAENLPHSNMWKLFKKKKKNTANLEGILK